MTHRSPRPVADVPGWLDDLITGASTLGIVLDPGTADRFREYAALLQSWGRRINLTSRLEPQEILSLHFLDSLALLAVQPPSPGSSLADLGSGAGFPGLPLKLIRPDLRITLLESHARKASFLATVIGRLGLQGVTLLRTRAGEGKILGEAGHDLVVARGVAPFKALLPLAARLLRPGGRLAAWKGPEEACPEPCPASWSCDEKHLLAIPGRPDPRAIFLFTHR